MIRKCMADPALKIIYAWWPLSTTAKRMFWEILNQTQNRNLCLMWCFLYWKVDKVEGTRDFVFPIL